MRVPYKGISGDEGTRTPNPCLAKAVLSQLSYIPKASYQAGGDRPQEFPEACYL